MYRIIEVERHYVTDLRCQRFAFRLRKDGEDTAYYTSFLMDDRIIEYNLDLAINMLRVEMEAAGITL